MNIIIYIFLLNPIRIFYNNTFMIKYFMLIIIIIIIIILLYIRIKFRFWSKQPVFHIYDIWYYLFPCGIIKLDLPNQEDEYNNFRDIQTIKLEKLSSIQEKRLLFFIQTNFLRSKELNYKPTKENIIPYFTGLDGGSVFISLYTKKNMMLDTTTQTVIEDNIIIGSMISYPVQVIFNNGNPNANINVYYVDYLCVDKDYRKQNIAPQLIQTHHYHQRHMNTSIQVSLFKREGDLTAIIPLSYYNCFSYCLKKLKSVDILPNINIVKINHKDLSFFYDFINLNHIKFEIYISSSLANISELIKTENIFIYGLIEQNTVLCLYFFKKQCTYLGNSRDEIITCYGSINCCKDVNLFQIGFHKALLKLIKEYSFYKMLLIDDNSDNNFLIKYFSNMTSSLFQIKTAYYFYNFAHKTYPSNKILVLL